MKKQTRRDFLVRFGRASLLPSLAALPGFSRAAPESGTGGTGIGLALGSGGAGGLAHIVVIEALEELGVRPARIAGSSIGAVIGALHAAGHDSKGLKKLIAELIPDDLEDWTNSLFDKARVTLFDFFGVDLEGRALADQEGFRGFLEEKLGVGTFEELDIPLSVAAADFWDRSPVILEEGPLVPAVLASAALPGVFPAVEHRGRLLVDGGMVHPVPFELLSDRVSATIAVDVIGRRSPGEDGKPGYMDAVFGSFDIMQASITREKRARGEPEIYLQPPLTDVRVLDFHKSEEIYAQAAGIKDELKRALDRVLG